MRIRTRYMWLFSIGTFIMFFAVAMAISGLIGGANAYMPLEEMSEGAATLVVLVSTFLPVLIGGGLWGAWFAGPVITLLLMIRELSAGNNDLSTKIVKLYTRKNKLKRRYRLYKEVLDDLVGLAEYLGESERLRTEQEENKKKWITGISHDLKTPLSYITGCAELLLGDYEFEQQERQQFLRSIYDKGITIGELIEDLNMSFKAEEFKGDVPLTVSDFDFVDFIRRLTADIINDPRASGYDLSLQCDNSSLEIRADRRLLQRAFQNIIMNGILHNPQGTAIEISIRLTPERVVQIKIQDNGWGIDEDAMKNLFTRYYRNPAKEDTNFSGGLGLSVAKTILEAHGGTISVESVLSQGTVFTVTVPVFFLSGQTK